MSRSNGVDLSNRALSDAQAVEVQEVLECRAGMRCGGCGRRITFGTKFFSIDPRAETPMQARCACSRPDCSYMEECRPNATGMEMIEFAWLDENGPDAPPARAIVKANERLAAQQQPES